MMVNVHSCTFQSIKQSLQYVRMVTLFNTYYQKCVGFFFKTSDVLKLSHAVGKGKMKGWLSVLSLETEPD